MQNKRDTAWAVSVIKKIYHEGSVFVRNHGIATAMPFFLFLQFLLYIA